MQIRFFTAQEATKIIMDKLRSRGLATFISDSTVLEIVTAMYSEGEELIGKEKSPYVLGERLQDHLDNKFGG